MAERNRRVLVFNHFAAPRGQAGGTRHVELFGRLEGWDHLIIASDLNPQSGRRVSGEPGFTVVRVPAYSTNGMRRILNWLAYAWRAALVGLQQRHVDIVYGSSPHLLAAVAAWAVAAVKRVPFVLEVRDLWPKVLVDMGALSPTSPVFRVLSRIESFLYRRATAIVVMAEGTRTELLGRGVPARRIAYVPNGADPADFVASQSRKDLRDRYGFSRFTAVYAGAHGPANGLDLVLDAARDVQHLAVDIVLVGGGVEKAGLEARARTEGLDNVRFLDPVPKSEIPDLLAGADVGLHVLADVELFRTSVSPNKVFDYLASGLPVLTNCPGFVSEIVERSGAGIGVGPDQIGHGLARLLDEDLTTMRAKGPAWIANNQSRSMMGQRLNAVLRSTRPTWGAS